VASLLTQMQIAKVCGMRIRNNTGSTLQLYMKGFIHTPFFWGGDTPPTSEIPPRNFWPGL